MMMILIIIRVVPKNTHSSLSLAKRIAHNFSTLSQVYWGKFLMSLAASHNETHVLPLTTEGRARLGSVTQVQNFGPESGLPNWLSYDLHETAGPELQIRYPVLPTVRSDSLLISITFIQIGLHF
jgi:hypothetical protein